MKVINSQGFTGSVATMGSDLVVTNDLAEFGGRELHLAGKLLSTYKTTDDITHRLNHPVQLCFNKQSGNVFLSDGDFNVAMMKGECLEDWISCPECGHEDFYSDFEESSPGECCRDYYMEVSPI